MLTALAISLAPILVQGATLAWTQSSLLTAVAGFVLTVLLVAWGLWGLARAAGTIRAVPAGSIVSVVLAIATYQVIAFAIAHVINAVWFAAP